MADPDVELDVTEQLDGTETEAGDSKRSRLALVIVLLLLLLLCVITTAVDVWVNRDPDTIRFVVRNLDCLQCHTELIPELSYPSVHDPFLRKECTVCHTPHGEEVEYSVRAGASKTWQRVRVWFEWLPLKFVLWAYDGVAGVVRSDTGGQVVEQGTSRVKGVDSESTLPSDELCWICHGDLGALLADDYPHNPFEQGYCTNCHDPHASKHRVLLAQDERDLCVTCHPMGAELSRAQVHPPAGERYCTNCHDPHASDHKGILVTNQRDLCFICHPSVAPLSLKAVQHYPFQYDNCTGCHEPHGSDWSPLLIDGTPPLCYTCHPTIQKDFQKPSHHPVGTVELRCEDCHNPHAADYEFLLTARDNSFCYQCHRDPIAVTYERSAHLDTLCIRCHSPHGTDWAPLLRQRNPDVCLECHSAAVDHDNAHPFRPNFYDVSAKSGMTCTSSCHDPHGTLHSDWMVKYKSYYAAWRMDGFCRQCHAGVGQYF